MGLKLILVSGLALFMTIPALFVGSLVEERTQRAKDVIEEISARMGGRQTFLGPTLSIPYTVPPLYQGAPPEVGLYAVFPTQGTAEVKIRTEERRRSLFKVPVFVADLKFDAAFDLTGVPSAAPPGAELDWTRAGIVIGVSDPRGALADGTLTFNGKTTTLVPAETLSTAASQQRLSLTYFGVAAARPNATFRVTSVLRFSGAQRISILAYGKTTHFRAEGDWPSPSFRWRVFAGYPNCFCPRFQCRVGRAFPCPRHSGPRYE